MGAFNTQKQLEGDASLIPIIASKMDSCFMQDGYSVIVKDLYGGGSDISISKGNIFKAVLGMRTALKITLTPNGNGIYFDAGIGVLGQQIIPTLITWYIAWPVLLAQIWGMVKQAKLDDRALQIAEQVISERPKKVLLNKTDSSYCSYCGHLIPSKSLSCPGCGRKNE